MTDKEIIIDDVNVAECRFYSKRLITNNGAGFIQNAECVGFCTHNIRGLDDSSCYDPHINFAKCLNNNCYYKQLKCLEQENKSLKNNLKCKHLVLDECSKTGKNCKGLKNCFEELEKENEKLRDNKFRELARALEAEDKYKSALKKIRNDLKEICKEECDYTKPKFCGDCDCRYGQILEKINEVLK